MHSFNNIISDAERKKIDLTELQYTTNLSRSSLQCSVGVGILCASVRLMLASRPTLHVLSMTIVSVLY
jgi:hypothetical protein